MEKLVDEPEVGIYPPHSHAEVWPKYRTILRQMVDRLTFGSIDRMEAQRARMALHFKRCPLCSSLNAIDEFECGTCSWAGAFEHDPLLIEQSLKQMIQRCPELGSAFPEATNNGLSLKIRLRKFWQGLFRKRLDFRA